KGGPMHNAKDAAAVVAQGRHEDIFAAKDLEHAAAAQISADGLIVKGLDFGAKKGAEKMAEKMGPEKPGAPQPVQPAGGGLSNDPKAAYCKAQSDTLRDQHATAAAEIATTVDEAQAQFGKEPDKTSDELEKAAAKLRATIPQAEGVQAAQTRAHFVTMVAQA